MPQERTPRSGAPRRPLARARARPGTSGAESSTPLAVWSTALIAARDAALAAAQSAVRSASAGALLAAALAGLTSACGDVGAAADPRPGDLFIVDMDAGPAQPDGERLGVIFRARADGSGGKGGGDASGEGPGDGSKLVLTTFAEDSRWREPVDVLVLPDRCVLILDQQWQPDDGPARGAIFRTWWAGGPVTLVWSDPRARQLVAMAWSQRDRMLYVSDRDADPLGLGGNTGCVFAVPIASDNTAGEATIAAAGPELVTPGALAVLGNGRVLLMDADANPEHVLMPDGRDATPGVLFELRDGALIPLLVPDATVSPIALIERDLRDPNDPEVWREERDRRRAERMRDRHVHRIESGPPNDRQDRDAVIIEEGDLDEEALDADDMDGSAHVDEHVADGSDDEGVSDEASDETPIAPIPPPPPLPGSQGEGSNDLSMHPKVSLFLVDANEGTEHGVVGDGALFRVEFPAEGATLRKLIDSLSLGRPRAMVDPAGGDVLADGRLVIADANADPKNLGEDGTRKGVYGTGRGALLAVDPDAGTVTTLLASDLFVSPVAVRRVR